MTLSRPLTIPRRLLSSFPLTPSVGSVLVEFWSWLRGFRDRGVVVYGHLYPPVDYRVVPLMRSSFPRIHTRQISDPRWTDCGDGGGRRDRGSPRHDTYGHVWKSSGLLTG